MKLIERKAYLDQLQAVKGIPDIKVITGIRRSGKSKLMDAFIASFPEDEQTSIIRIKLNLKSFERKRIFVPHIQNGEIIRRISA